MNLIIKTINFDSKNIYLSQLVYFLEFFKI